MTRHLIPTRQVAFTNGRTEAILPELFTVWVTGIGRCCRVQVPLMMAFAITIHKSQGMSLDAADVHVGDCFTAGQGYVAISRVRTFALRLQQQRYEGEQKKG